MGVDVFVADEQADRPVEVARWAALAEAVLRAEGVRGEAELSVLYVDESAIAALNSRFLGKDGPTDVLSFPIEDEVSVSGRSPDSGGTGPGWMPPEDEPVPTLLGDVVICPEVAWRQAPDHAGEYDDEMALLLVHGILHLLGMDHEEEQEAVVMERREQQLLDKFHRQGATNGTSGPTAAGGTSVTSDPGGTSGTSGTSDPGGTSVTSDPSGASGTPSP